MTYTVEVQFELHLIWIISEVFAVAFAEAVALPAPGPQAMSSDIVSLEDTPAPVVGTKMVPLEPPLFS